MAESQKSNLAANKSEEFTPIAEDKRKYDSNNHKKKSSSSERSFKKANEKTQQAMASNLSKFSNTDEDCISTGSLSPRPNSKNLEWQPPRGLDTKTPGNEAVSKRYLELELNKFKTDLKSMITDVVRGPALSDKKRKRSDYDNKHGGEVHSISDSYDSDDDISILTQSKYKIPRVEDTDTVVNQIDALLREGETDSDKDKGENSSYDEEEFEKFLQQEYTFKEKTGPEINAKIADIIDKLFGPVSRGNQDETIKGICDKFPRPANLKVYPTRVNKELWSSLKNNSKLADIKLQKTGDKMVYASYAISSLLDDLMKIKNSNSKKSGTSSLDFTTVIKKALDALTLLGTSVCDLNQRRRDAMRFRISSQLCSAANNAEVGASPLLFGDDLPKKMKELKDIQQMGSKVTNSNYSYNHNYPKGNSRYSSDKGKAFLWKKTPRRATGYSQTNSYSRSKTTTDKKK